MNKAADYPQENIKSIGNFNRQSILNTITDMNQGINNI
jgi:hypothetical protein